MLHSRAIWARTLQTVFVAAASSAGLWWTGLSGRACHASAIQTQRWSTIGSPGNQPYRWQNSLGDPFEVGRVDYEYRMAQTEVTGAMWFEFVQAYAPYVEPGFHVSTEFTSFQVQIRYNPDNTVRYVLPESNRERAVQVGWRFAARFCNWLHNNQASNREAFEQGVYDTSTFGEDASGNLTDQATRSPGSRYWIPTRDEWVKAAYYDPNRYGLHQPGYWQYPTMSDLAPIPGPPGVGQTSAGWDFFQAQQPLPTVGAYSNITSPWGLFDLSGGQQEWLEDRVFSSRETAGTRVGESDNWFYDRIGWLDAGFVFAPIGLRLASEVPSPGAALVLSLLSVCTYRRRS